MDAKIFRVNYKSDFILTLTSDAGWMIPFCVKFWTGSPMLAYYASYDGETYTHCTYDPAEPTKLTVQFDDHNLPIGNLKYQVAYHFTVADFPENTEDEVTNQANVTTVIDGDTYQVMLDLNGETAPEIQFALPAYANELQRIQNEQTRIAQEQQRITQEQQRVNQEAARVTEFNGIKAEAIADHQRANEDHSRAQTDHQNALADRSQAASDHNRAVSDHNTADSDHSQANSDHSRAQSDHNTALSDHQTALSDHTQSNTDHTRAESDHTRATADSSTAAADHRTASDDHTQANTDHARAESDHQRVETDLAEVEEFSNSLGAYDISAAHATGSTLATYPDLATALGPNGSNIPEAIRKGGMSVKFVQSSDNNSTKYAQYRLMSDTFNTTPANWQGVDKMPTAGSSNLVESGGVAEIINGPLYIEYGKRFMSNGYALNVSQYACTNKLQGNGDYVFPRIALGYRVFKYISDSEGVELTDGNWKTTELTLTINDPFIVTFNGGSQTPDWSPLNNYSIEGVGTGLKGETEKLKSGKVDKVQGKGLSTEDFTSEEKAKLDALPTNSELTAAFGNKVDKVEGKGLSENDFTDDLKEVVDKVDDNLVCVAGVSSKNMVNLAALVSGYRVLKTNGSLYADASYSYITLDVTGIANLAISASISITSGFAFAFYNGDTFISGDNPDISTLDSYSRKYVSVSVPSNATKMIVSNPTSTWNARNWQIEEGTTSTAYEPYSPPTAPNEFLKKSFLSPVIRTVLGSGGLRGYSAALTNGQSVSLKCGSIRKNQRIHFYAKITSFDAILVGKGTTDKGYLLKVDDTNIQFKAGIDSAGGSTIPHGLTIASYIDVLITIHANGGADIQLDTLTGSYKRHLATWANVMGDVVAISDGSSLTECILTWNCADFKKPIWAYGDSYFSHYSENRWPYYMIVRDENDCCLLNAFPGEDSQEAYADFLENAKQGVPNTLIWCLGMNNPDSGTVNADWLSVVEKLESYCESYGVELILSTTPCVPSYSHVYKNAWVKASGYRYIDFAEAVSAEEAGSTWISGTLSTDNVHPTADGARLLYSRAISDIPELLGEHVVTE